MWTSLVISRNLSLLNKASRCIGVLLAAGLGSRYQRALGTQSLSQQNKLLVPFDPQQIGKTSHDIPVIFEHALKNLSAQVEQVIVVTRPEYTQVQQLTEKYDATLLVLSSVGMGSSIAAALNDDVFDEDVKGCLICLGDMPNIAASSYQAILANLTPDHIVAPCYDNQRGHPVGFGRNWFADLRLLSGDQGPRHLLRGKHFVPITVTDSGVIYDIDTPSQLL